ncbi:uncharacterized protein LOC128021444 isoform X1 [Carassius gibelio]|uniref:uncharacterized protein LOC128021444 isoform X1 n=1 Tax=Carassius gibelio TaxID=101364 RepID=UPI002279CEB0|nr:uncharacterized protein LOC128021444 isoform X1 [Carassius gibelio]
MKQTHLHHGWPEVFCPLSAQWECPSHSSGFLLQRCCHLQAEKTQREISDEGAKLPSRESWMCAVTVSSDVRRRCIISRIDQLSLDHQHQHQHQAV